jgi:hypothetical protein
MKARKMAKRTFRTPVERAADEFLRRLKSKLKGVNFDRWWNGLSYHKDGFALRFKEQMSPSAYRALRNAIFSLGRSMRRDVRCKNPRKRFFITCAQPA